MGIGPFEEILTVSQLAEVTLIKSVLQGERIHYVAQGEHHNAAEGVPVRFLVPAAEVERAREALRDFL